MEIELLEEPTTTALTVTARAALEMIAVRQKLGRK